MKKIALFASALVFSLVAMAQTKSDDIVKFNTEKHDFGKIKQGVPVTYYFEIKKPINPGATGKVKVQYNAATVGPFKKDVIIKLAGVDQPKTVQIVGEVLANDKSGKK